MSGKGFVDVPEIDIDNFAQRHAEGVAVIDVRTPEEYAGSHVPGALLVPLADITERVDELPSDTTIYVVCATGRRSARATEYLVGQGLDAVNAAGGMKAWTESGFATAAGDAPG